MVNIRNFALTVLLMGDVKKSATMYIVFMTVLIALLGLRFVGNIVFFFFFLPRIIPAVIYGTLFHK